MGSNVRTLKFASRTFLNSFGRVVVVGGISLPEEDVEDYNHYVEVFVRCSDVYVGVKVTSQGVEGLSRASQEEITL